MSHVVTVLLGPARCGKTRLLVGRYRQILQSAARAAGRALWLAPTARSAAAVRDELVRDGLSACLDPGVTTFDALAGRVLANVAEPPRATTPLVERVLLGRIIETAIKNKRLVYLAEMARRASFVDLVDEHIHELKRYGITPAAFARSVGSRGDRRQHEELAQLYADYERLLQTHRLADEEGRHWAVRDALASDATLPETILLADVQLVVADGFTDFTHTQQEILGELARRAGRLYVSLPGDHSLPLPLGEGRGEGAGGRGELFAKTHATLAELRLLFPKLTVERLPCRETTWPALDHIAQHLFEHPRDIPPPSPAAAESLDRLEIVAAAGVQDEIVELARNIKLQLIDERNRTGVARPGDVVVVFRNLREAAPRVRDVFAEFGIPHSLEAGVPLAATGVVRTLLDLLRLDAEDWPFRRAVSVATNNLLTAVDRSARTAAEWLIRDLQIAQGHEKLLDRVSKLAGELTSASGESEPAQPHHPHRPHTHHDRQIQSASTALPFLRQLAAALDELPTAATPPQWITAFAQLGERLGIRCLTRSTEDPDNNTAWQEVSKHFAALARLADWMNESAPQLSRAAVLDLLVDLAKHESLPRRFDDTGRVRVLSAATARTVAAKHVFLAGMSEQAFPSPERAGNLYSEADYRFFANAADQSRAAAELPSVQRAQDEMLLFYEVLTRAGERLTISYPALDEKAQTLSPSPYVTEVERAIHPAPVTHHRAARPSPLPTGDSPLSPTDWRIQAVHQALNGDLGLLAGLFRSGATGSTRLSSPKPASAPCSASGIETALRVTASRSRRDGFGPAEGLLEGDAVRARLARRFGSDHLWSPSQWERYALCPYKFFMNDVLGREPLGELVLETDHRQRGTLVHRVLAEFHRRMPELLGKHANLSSHDAEKFSAEFGNILDALVRATPHTGIEAALVELDRRQIDKWAPRYHVEHGKYDAAWPQLDQPLKPTYLEWRFGPSRSGEIESAENDYEDPRSTSQPFILDLGHEKIRITGRIDRIDVGQSDGRSVFNVIDYKSGKRPSLSNEKIATGERLQPALYVMAAQALLFEGDTATPLWAGYWSMANGVTVDARFSLQCSQDFKSPTENWEKLRGSVVEQIGRFVHDIRGGNFPVASRDDKCTSYCEFSTVCRVGQVRSLGKQWFGEEADT